MKDDDKDTKIVEAAGTQDEQTVEDILSSIRKIINEETTSASKTESSGVLNLTDDMAADKEEVTAIGQEATQKQQEAQQQPSKFETDIKEKAKNLGEIENLLSEDTKNESTAAFSKLGEAADMKQGKDPIGAQNLEQLMQAVLRPLLKEWLDANLPKIVEKLVAREIARISHDSENLNL